MKGVLPKCLSAAVILALAMVYSLPVMACHKGACCGQPQAVHCSTADAPGVSAPGGCCCDLGAPAAAPDEALAEGISSPSAQGPHLYPAASQSVKAVTGGEGPLRGREHVPRALACPPLYKLTSSYLC